MNIEYNSKEVIVLYNKLVIYNEEQFDMVICKNKKDAQRLHHTLYEATRGLKIKNLLLFFRIHIVYFKKNIKVLSQY